MATIARRSRRAPISPSVTLATAGDLDGTADGTQEYDVTGADRIIVVQDNTGAAGTAGIDVIEISHDGGNTWASADQVLALASNDATGTEINGVLNAAGVEPTTAAIFKCGPYAGPIAIRCTRNVATNAASAAWVTGAPAVYAFIVGGNAGAAPSLA